MNFSDIPQMTKAPNYRVTVSWSELDRHLAHWAERDIAMDLDPDFQRAHVWNEEKQRRYVEYVLRGGSSSRELYFNCRGWMGSFDGPMLLVDGKQRLEAVRRFMRDELRVFPTFTLRDGWNVETHAGHLISEIGGRLGYDCAFYFNVNDLKTRAQVLQWYIDLNDGGVAHTSEEIAKVRDLLAKEAK